MRMLWRRSFELGRHRMGGRLVMIMPMDMNGTDAVPMDVPMADQNAYVVAHRRIEGIVFGVDFICVAMIACVVMDAVAVVMLGKAGGIGMRMASVIERHHHIETMRLRNHFERFPERAPVDQGENLAGARFPPRLHVHPIGRGPG